MTNSAHPHGWAEPSRGDWAIVCADWRTPTCRPIGAHMKRGFVLGALVIVGGLSAALGATEPAQAPGQPPSASALQVDKIRDNLYVLRGGGGNSAVFVTANGVVLVDTKLPGWGKPILEKIKELTDKPVATI